MYLNAVNRQRFKAGLFFLVFTISYTINWIIINITNVKLISAINLNLFSFWISLVITAVVLLLEDGQIMLHVRMSLSSRSNKIIISCVALVIGAIILIFVYMTINFNQIAFEEWSHISLLRIAFFLATFSVALYAPAYILHKTLLRKFKWSIIEKVVFYPVLSAMILVLLEVIGAIVKIDILCGAFFVGLLGGAAIVFLNEHHCTSNRLSLQCVSVNLKEALALTVAVGFNLFIFYSAVGGENVFLRGDMWGEAQAVAFLIKYGLNSYLASPVQNYPPFFRLFWSASLKLLPFPYLNGLLIFAFFNHLFSVLSFYMLARMLFKDSRAALLSVILWTTLSGFSWVYLMRNPPLGLLSGNKLLEYVTGISNKFGVTSGAISSPIYADDHALTRLWSLGLSFVSITALLKGYLSKNIKSLTEGLLIFSVGFIQILLGHVYEDLLLGIALFALLILTKEDIDKYFMKIILLVTTVLSGISVIITILVYGVNIFLILIATLPALAILAKIVLKTFTALYKSQSLRNVLIRILERTRTLIPYLALYLYGLMWIALWLHSPHIKINWPIITVWYYPAFDFGFIGLLSVFVLIFIGHKKEKMQHGLIFVISIFVLLLFLLVLLNYVNYNFLYVTTPYSIYPVLFFPLLALIAGGGFSTFKLEKRKRIQFIASVILIAILLSFGSLNQILSASYWRTNNGWWLNHPLNPTSEDYQLINFLYAQRPTMPYEFVATFYDWYNPSSYVVYPSGMTLLSRPLMEIFSFTNDSREIYLLTHVLPITYILVPNEGQLPSNESYVANAIRNIDPIFSNNKYKLFSVSQLNLSKTNLLPSSKDFLTVESMYFEGSITLSDNLTTRSFNNVNGEVYPLGDGKVSIKISSQLKGNITNIIASTPSMNLQGKITLIGVRSTWGYFYEFGCEAERMVILGNISSKIFNTVKSRIYMEQFSYVGKIEAYPAPQYLRSDYARKQMTDYLNINYVDPMEVVRSPAGLIWSLIIVIVFIAELRMRSYRKFQLRIRLRRSPSIGYQ